MWADILSICWKAGFAVCRWCATCTRQPSKFPILFFPIGEFEFTRIVAVEFPRKGTWQLGFVTGEGLPEVRSAIGEPILTVLVPYSPLPITGCTITVRKSECIDLNITFDQACEYIVSCGVVVPSMKLEQMRSLHPLPCRRKWLSFQFTVYGLQFTVIVLGISCKYGRACIKIQHSSFSIHHLFFILHPSFFILFYASPTWNSCKCVGPMAGRLGSRTIARFGRRGGTSAD